MWKRTQFPPQGSATNGMITIRPIANVDEMRSVEALQQEVWGISDREVVSFMMFIPTLAVGGLLLGAFDGEEMAGFSYAFPGLENGLPILHSDMLAVRESYRDQQIGYRLKLAQREHALAAGIDCVTWTFDPLQSRNAHLNFGKLGVVGTAYKPDFYGPSSSPLHQGGTDRLWLNWHLDSPRVRERVEGSRFKVQGLEDAPRLARVAANGEPQVVDVAWETIPEPVLLEIPLAVAEWQKTDLPLVARWRGATRRAFTEAFAKGYYVADFAPVNFDGAGCGVYVLRRK